MLNPSFGPFQGGFIPGIDAHVSIGLLLPPDAFASACALTRQRPQFDGWALSVRMADSELRCFESPLVPSVGGISIVRSRSNVYYAVVTVQVGSTQMRMVLSLADERTRTWFRSVTSMGLFTLAIDVPERQQFAVAEMRCARRGAAELDEFLSSGSGISRLELEADAAGVVGDMSRKQAVPSLINGYDTESIRLVLVFDAADVQPEPSGTAKRLLN